MSGVLDDDHAAALRHGWSTRQPCEMCGTLTMLVSLSRILNIGRCCPACVEHIFTTTREDAS